MKILIYGLKNAGKTCLIQNVLGGMSWEELVNIEPTEFIDTKEYIYRGLLKINVFDAGGQDQFLKQYYEDQWRTNVFGNCLAFFYVVDSSNLKQLQNAKKEFYKALSQIQECSEVCQQITLVISKTDIAERSPKKIRNFILEHSDYSKQIKDRLNAIAVSIPHGSARRNFGKALNKLISDKTKSKQLKLNKLCESFNKKFNSIYSLILNKQDGLEIASAIDTKLMTTKLKDELEYTSLKALTHSEKEANIFKLLMDNELISSNNMGFRLYETQSPDKSEKKEIILLEDLSKEIGFFAIFDSQDFNYDKIRSANDSLREKVLDILNL
jgi:GTPase SAR1 family protein